MVTTAPFRKSFVAIVLLVLPFANAFAPVRLSTQTQQSSTSQINGSKDGLNSSDVAQSFAVAASSFLLGVGIMGSALVLPQSALADEYGREVEAPTLFTGETTMICVKRGPLGACTKTEMRTVDNDNDKATKYFKDPQDSLREKYSATQLQTIDDGETRKVILASDGNELIERLKQQSEDNKVKNDKIIRAKTLQNDLGASFGPLDSQVVILNADGENYTLLKGAQAMRLKKAGYIKDKKFVTQPSQEVIDQAYDAPEGSGPGAFFGGLVKGVFGGEEE